MLRALEHKNGQLPDRVPTFVEGMMADFKRKCDDQYGEDLDDDMIFDLGANWAFTRFFKFDSQWLHSTPVNMKPLKGIEPSTIELGDPNLRLNRWGHIATKTSGRSTGEAWGYSTGYLNTKEEWQKWIDAGYFDFDVSAEWIRMWEKDYPKFVEKDLILVPVDVIFEKIREAFDFGKFAYFLRKERAFMEEITRKIFKMGMAYVKGVCDAGFEIITIADDTAYKNRVMYSPKIFEELVAPRYKELNDYIHKRGLLSFYHSDGFTEPYFPGLIGAGFNGIQSLEPAAGMDLKHLKEVYGEKVSLIGNLDCSRLLPFGTMEEVAAATRQCLDDAMAGGGYICGPTTDIIDSCKPENIKTMVDTVHKYGVYK
jgi:hypothetical protein